VSGFVRPFCLGSGLSTLVLRHGMNRRVKVRHESKFALKSDLVCTQIRYLDRPIMLLWDVLHGLSLRARPGSVH
jgi:hypothetical protein